MYRFARDGGHLANLIGQAAVVARAAASRPVGRRAAGRPCTFATWQIAVLIFVAVARRCKTKSSQYRFLCQHWQTLGPLLSRVGVAELPGRATYMRRYGPAWPLYEKMIEIGGRRALAEGVGDSGVVAVDKSLVAARGPPGARRRGADTQAGWGRCAHDGWVWGWCYEAVVCARKNKAFVPILASADRADRSEHKSFASKIARLPRATLYVLADSGYDNNAFGEAIEFTARGRRTGRRFLCPMQARGGKPAVGRFVHKGRRERRRLHRRARAAFLASPRGRRLYARRRVSVEPVHHWFKHLFDWHERAWHRGLDNNRTALLACLFCYQLLLRYNHALGHHNARVQWILDGL